MSKPARGKRAKAEPQRTPLLDFQGTKREKLQQLFDLWYACRRCQLADFRSNDEIVFGEGNPNAHVVVLGESPGEQEERTSVPFVGPAGQLLNQIIAQVSDDPEIQALYDEYYKTPRSGRKAEEYVSQFHERMFEYRNTEFFIVNGVACRPPENRQPTNLEVKACFERLWNIIYIVDPLIIIACGNTAMSALLRKVQVQITRMRGNVYDVDFDGRFGPVTYPVIPTFHPSYLLRKADWKDKNGDFAKTVEDWRKAMRVLDFLREKHFGTPIPHR